METLAEGEGRFRRVQLLNLPIEEWKLHREAVGLLPDGLLNLPIEEWKPAKNTASPSCRNSS